MELLVCCIVISLRFGKKKRGKPNQLSKQLRNLRIWEKRQWIWKTTVKWKWYRISTHNYRETTANVCSKRKTSYQKTTEKFKTTFEGKQLKFWKRHLKKTTISIKNDGVEDQEWNWRRARPDIGQWHGQLE